MQILDMVSLATMYINCEGHVISASYLPEHFNDHCITLETAGQIETVSVVTVHECRALSYNVHRI